MNVARSRAWMDDGLHLAEMGDFQGEEAVEQAQLEQQDDQDMEIPVRVAVRVRPLNPEEEVKECLPCIKVVGGRQVVVGKQRGFTYDVVYNQDCGQEELFSHSVYDLVDGVLQGYNATVLAYGQTGSGKTYTMGMSSAAARMSKENVDKGNTTFGESLGIAPRVCSLLFEKIGERKDEGAMYTVRMTYLEIYNETVRDLLGTNSKKDRKVLGIRDMSSGVFVQGAEEVTVSNVQEVFEQVEIGTIYRATGSTQMNAKSSRSHAILTLIVEQHVPNSRKMRVAKFHLVDLAGSERNKRTGAVGQRFQESIRINQGLLALGNVISVLGDESRAAERRNHVPYRQSKLTRLLRDSLGGNSRTLFIACISPADESFAETLNTLKYANRARNIRNMPIINNHLIDKEEEDDSSDEEEETKIRQLEEKIESLMRDREEAMHGGEDGRKDERAHRNVRQELQDILDMMNSGDPDDESPEHMIRNIQLGIRRVINSDRGAVLEIGDKNVADSGDCSKPTCLAEKQELREQYEEAKADLERDEVIFANRMDELQSLRKQIQAIHEDREQLRLRLVELEEENNQLLGDDASPKVMITPNSVVSAFGGSIHRSPGRDSPMVAMVKQYQTEIQERDEQLREASRQIADLRNQMETLEESHLQAMAVSKKDLKNALKSVDAKKHELEMVKSERDYLMKECSKKDNEIDVLKKRAMPPSPIDISKENVQRNLDDRLKHCLDVYLSARKLRRQQLQTGKLEESKNELEQSLRLIQDGQFKEKLRQLEQKKRNIEDKIAELEYITGADNIEDQTNEMVRLQRERIGLLTQIEMTKMEEESLKEAVHSIDELVEEESMSLAQAKRQLGSKYAFNHGNGDFSLEMIFKDELYPMFRSMAPREQQYALEVLGSQIAILEQKNMGQENSLAQLKMKVQIEQSKCEQLYEKLKLQELEHAKSKQQPLESNSRKSPRSVDQEKLDQQYIKSLEKDIKFHKKTINELKHKAKYAFQYLTELTELKEEHQNLKEFLKRHASAGKGLENYQNKGKRGTTPSPTRRKNIRKDNNLPVPVRISRAQLQEISMN